MPATKDRTQKTTREMSFDEFRTWACGHLVFEIGAGHTLQETMYMILNQAALNEVWGGNRPAREQEI